MNSLVAIFIVVLVVPLLAGSWRLALAGLGAQAVLLFFMMFAGGHEVHTDTAVLLAVDLLLIRGLLGPLSLRSAALRAGTGRDLEVVPGNLLHWVVGLTLVVLAASFAQRVAPDDPWRAAHFGAAAAEVLIGLAVVAQHRSPLAQVIGVLTIENGVLLFEATIGYHWPAALHVGFTAVFGGLILLASFYLRALVAMPPEPDGSSSPAAQEVVL